MFQKEKNNTRSITMEIENDKKKKFFNYDEYFGKDRLSDIEIIELIKKNGDLTDIEPNWELLGIDKNSEDPWGDLVLK